MPSMHAYSLTKRCNDTAGACRQRYEHTQSEPKRQLLPFAFALKRSIQRSIHRLHVFRIKQNRLLNVRRLTVQQQCSAHHVGPCLAHRQSYCMAMRKKKQHEQACARRCKGAPSVLGGGHIPITRGNFLLASEQPAPFHKVFCLEADAGRPSVQAAYAFILRQSNQPFHFTCLYAW